ncbi:MAG: tRNA (adenine(22)-N(1))-methyltransferase TrmK [Rickettsiales bacterium]|jgi:tRNA (adenine22-N1)-methyltransferase|nr:tRNA (adenine(22)-N(1))-methyltransferase TrmK [Rickettsiales bacterium]
MHNIKLSPRLGAIQKQITKKNSVIVDVGCDHCFTSIYALISHKAKFAFNIDIRPNPLNTGIENIKKYGLINQTDNFIADGLKTDKINKKIDYCVISGIGGNKIANILTNRNKNIKISEYILLSNDHPEVIRKYIKINNLRIFYEEIIIRDKYFFHLIKVSNKGLKVINENDITFGSYNLKHKTKNFISYQKYLLEKRENIKLYRNI